ncbi:GNAT family N-acetyltransferase [Roseobacter sinensis]|uniref:N-acetyltransferase family protein n=1 Tax=Roseobacter sinensis TaxID=2931391 RepID=A0ABT3BHT8_9RHOB|nr:GNAT family N-acetyltransferase [Roseobacter sp. WL0113]MCV3272949.1 N-acetyltransferase family protein [Roseobacter sp. WL0113]
MIRPAEPVDAPAIAALWNAMIRETLSTFTTVEKTDAEIEALISERRGAVFVAESAGACGGFVTFGPFRAGPGYAATVEHTVIVASTTQRAGVGRRLMLAAEEAARADGKHVMVGGISQTNIAAQAFHARLGYAEVARMPEVGRKADRWLDLVLMQKIL